MHRLQQAGPNTPAPKAIDNFLLKQRVRKYEVDPNDSSRDIVVSDDGVAGLNTSREVPAFAASLVQVVYDASSRELQFRLEGYDSKLKRNRVYYEQAVTDVTLTGSDGKFVIRDKNMIVFATREGIRTVLLHDIQDNFLRASMPAPVAILGNILTGEGGSIRGIEFATPEAEPRDLTSLDGGALTWQHANDLWVKAAFSDGSAHTVHIPYHELMAGVAAGQLALLAHLQVMPRFSSSLVAEALSANPEQLRQGRQIQDEVARFQEQESQSSGVSSDLMTQVLFNLSLRTDQPARAKLLGGGTPQSSAYRVVGDTQLTPRHVFPAQPEAWTQEREKILGVRARGGKFGKMSWQEALGQYYKEHFSQAQASAEQVRDIEEKMDVSRIQQVLTTARKYVTPSTLAWLTAAVTFDAVGASTHGVTNQWAVSAVSHILNHTLQMPVISAMTQQIYSGLRYFESPFAMTKILMGLAFLQALRPMVVIATYRLSRMNREDFGDEVLTFFTKGIHQYGAMGRPLQRFVWELLKQSNVYYSFDEKLPLNTPGVWNAPWASRDRVQANRASLSQRVTETKVREARARLIALALVTEKASLGNSISADPVTLLQMIQIREAGSDEAVDAYLNSLGSLKSEAAWMATTETLIPALAKLTDQGYGDIDLDDARMVQEYGNAFEWGRKKLLEAENVSSNRAVQIGSWVKAKAVAFNELTAKPLLLMVGFGLQSHETSRKLRDAVLPENIARDAYDQLVTDYAASETMVAAVNPDGVGGIFGGGNVRDTFRLVADSLEQLFIYGGKNATEMYLAFFQTTTRFINPMEPVTNQIFNRGKSVENGGFGRQQTGHEVRGAILRRARDPNAAGILDVQSTRMYNSSIAGFQVNMLFGLIPRLLAEVGISLLTPGFQLAHFLPTLGGDMGAASFKQANVLFNKNGFQYGRSGFTFGYVLIWPPIIWLNNVLSSSAKSNQERMEMADYTLFTGINTEDPALMTQGVALIRGYYSDSRAEIPEKFRVPPESYDFPLARELMEYHRTHPSLADLPNQGWKTGANTVGAVVSAVLATGLSKLMYSPTVDPISQFSHSLEWFAVSYGVVLGANHLVKSGLRWANPKIDRWNLQHKQVMGATLEKLGTGIEACKRLLIPKSR